jgi:hypothetical protein
VFAETRLARWSEPDTQLPRVLARYLGVGPPSYLLLTIW